MSAQLKKVCHHGISPPVDSCFYCELNLCGRPLRSGRGCKRSVFHKETCFAPWPTTVFEHPWDCHCWECDKKTPPEDGDVPSPSDAAQPVAWRWYIEGQTGGWHYSNVRITQSGKRQVIEPLYAHPEDAPEGPWKIISTMEPDAFVVRKSGVKCGRGPFTWAEVVAVCDRLNRLHRRTGDKK